MEENYTNMDYRNAKIIHLLNEEGEHRFIYKNQEISQKEAIAIISKFYQQKEEDKKKNNRND